MEHSFISIKKFSEESYSKILGYPKSKVIALDRDEKSKIISSNIKKKFKNKNLDSIFRKITLNK